MRPEWSPDGDRIAFEGYGQDGWADIYVMDVSREGATSRPLRLTPDNLQQATEPSWSPDGTEIAFVGDQDIYKFDINTLVETRLTTWEGAGGNTSVEGSPTWSPEGERIAFVRDDSDASTSIYVMRSDGSDPTLIRDFPRLNDLCQTGDRCLESTTLAVPALVVSGDSPNKDQNC